MNTILDKSFVPHQFDLVGIVKVEDVFFGSRCNEFLNSVYYNSKNFRYLFFIFLKIIKAGNTFLIIHDTGCY